jgi:hypothetical protein
MASDAQDAIETFIPDPNTDDPVAYAREAALPVLRTVRRIALGGGGRGAREQLTASKLLLEVGKLLGPQRTDEAPKLSAVQEAAKVIYLVDADKAQELLTQQRAEQKR